MMYTFHTLKFNLTDRLFLQYYSSYVSPMTTVRILEKDIMHYDNIAS